MAKKYDLKARSCGGQQKSQPSRQPFQTRLFCPVRVCDNVWLTQVWSCRCQKSVSSSTFPEKTVDGGVGRLRPEAGRASIAGVRAGLELQANKGDGGRSPSDMDVGHAFFAWTCRGFLNHAKNSEKAVLCLVVDGKHKIATTGAVIATVSILAKSLELTNTDVVRRGLKRAQMPLHAGTSRPVLQACMDAETTPNFIRLFELFCEVIKSNLDYDPKPLVVQVQCDFSDAIEGAQRKVFPGSPVARDYPHMMRAVHAKLTAKTSETMRGRIIALVRATRHLPTLELFSAC